MAFGGGADERERARRAAARGRRFQSIPMPTQIDNETRKILIAIIDVVERRLLKVSKDNEKMMSRADLLKLGVVTQAQIDSLDRVDPETGA